MKRLFTTLALSALILPLLCSCNQECDLVAEGTKIIAHRGYWDCEGGAKNSIFALKKAQEIGAYGSEFDVYRTADGVMVVHHDATIKSNDGSKTFKIEETNYDEIKNITLSNGEKLPTVEQYLKQFKKSKCTRLVYELKGHSTPELETKAVEESVRLIKKHGLESRTIFISFSFHSCKEFHRLMPENEVQYLSGNLTPEEVHAAGIKGIDYQHFVFTLHPDYVQRAHDLGMTVNVWTVNDTRIFKQMINLGVDYVTTDKPDLFLITTNNAMIED